LEEMAAATFLNESTCSRKLWVYPINVERNEKGGFLISFPELYK